ncbi:MAG: tRNA dihydrouridine synthase DusB [Gemmataceae bacterium]|nr:tRNA dihydrouridine synthase DusB [Gemmataceae bacterium]
MLPTLAPSTPRTLQLGSLRLASRYFLAPLAGYTNWPFRTVVREIGGLGLATTDLVNARALMQQSRRTMELVHTTPNDRPLAIQLYGAEPKEMGDAARWVEAYGVQVIDINMGCPVHKVVKGGGGSAMMCNVGGALDVVRSVVEAVKIPVTVKMRLGWDDQNLSAPNFARAFEQLGVAAVIIHGRTREQGFGGCVSLDGIRQVVEAVDRMPVIGNGDVRTIGDAQRMLEVTGCAGISIGRGALINPWIFRQLVRWETTGDPGPSGGYEERLDLMLRHFRLLMNQRGERYASLTFRKMAGWYSKVMKPGRDLHERLQRLESESQLADILDEMRGKGPPIHWREGQPPEIAVPKGPISHW